MRGIQAKWQVRPRGRQSESAQITATWFDPVRPTTVQSFGFGLFTAARVGLVKPGGLIGTSDKRKAPAGPTYRGPVVRMFQLLGSGPTAGWLGERSPFIHTWKWVRLVGSRPNFGPQFWFSFGLMCDHQLSSTLRYESDIGLLLKQAVSCKFFPPFH